MDELDLPTVEEFQTVLDTAKAEEDAQRFLTRNHVLLTAGWENVVVVPKMRLGSEYVTDYAAAARASGTTYVTLIELELPSARPFNKSGRPGRRLASALKQVADWRYWIGEHESYFLDALPKEIRERGLAIGAAYPPPFAPTPDKEQHYYYRRKYGYLIVIGRRLLMEDQDLKARAAYLDQMPDVEIMTYDRLVDRLQNLWDLKLGKTNRMNSLFGH